MSRVLPPMNLLVIMADEHQRGIMGCYGNPAARTPNLDRLAAGGVRFTNAYTPSPICVPARAAFATGLPVHRTGHWDQAFPYTGEPRGWGHHLAAHGLIADAIGKLHYRRAEDDHGFRRALDAMYVAEGIGEIISCLRERAPHRAGHAGLIKAGPGESSYLNYDRRITRQAQAWLSEQRDTARPWVLFVSYVNPHPPFIAPPDLFAGYDPDTLPLPVQWQEAEWPRHPALDYFRRYFGWTRPLAEAELRRLLATYYAQVEWVDQCVGQLLDTLAATGLDARTRVLYTADHGAMLGARGLFGKFTLYDEAAAIPMLLSGPDIPPGRSVATPVSLLDCAPFIVEAVGAPPMQPAGPGESLWSLLHAGDHRRVVLSEYHAAGSLHAAYMVTDGRYKLQHYVNAPAQLFDLATDPHECRNVAGDPAYAAVYAQLETELRNRLDPDAVDRRAKADQRAAIEAFGGEAAVLARGLSNSPVPGEAPVFQRNLKAHEPDAA